MEEKISSGTVHRIPDDLKKALVADKKELEKWEGITPLARNEWICWTTYVKQQQTRDEHVARVVSELKEGMKRPCCWYGCPHRKGRSISPSVKFILSRKKN